MRARRRRTLIAIAWLASLAGVAFAAWQYCSQAKDAEVARWVENVDELRAQAVVRDSLDRIDSLVIASFQESNARLREEVDSLEERTVELEEEGARAGAAQAETGLALQDVLRGHPAGERLLARHLGADSVQAAVCESRIENCELRAARLDTLLMNERQVSAAHERRFLRADSTAAEALAQLDTAESIIRRQDNQLHPPFPVRAGRVGVEAGATYLIATQAFDVEPLEAALIAAGAPLAKCLLRHLPLIGRALSGGCVFDE